MIFHMDFVLYMKSLEGHGVATCCVIVFDDNCNTDDIFGFIMARFVRYEYFSNVI